MIQRKKITIINEKGQESYRVVGCSKYQQKT